MKQRRKLKEFSWKRDKVKCENLSDIGLTEWYDLAQGKSIRKRSRVECHYNRNRVF